jgi:alpha-tubulin suppressor-like RCC1 family protein
MNILSEYRICANLDTKFKLNIKLVFITKRNILIISYDKKVYEFECDKFGTFCSKDYQNGTVIEPKIIEKLNTSDIICFANGLKHIIALNNLGVVYSWGLNNYGQLGFGKRDNDYEEIASIDYFKNRKIAIKKICCGANHSLALSKSGHVFAWGDNEFGQIGNGKDKKPQSEPILLDGFENENILAISCGGQHSLAITQSGCVFSWGSNEFGQLGLEGYEMTNKPQKIVAIRDLIKKITCGAKHSLLLSREGKLFAFGSNEFGQVGEGSKKNIVLPHVIKSRILFKDIAANFEYNISIALSTSDVFYIWGKCGGEIFLEPEETPFKSFDDIFAHYYEITYGLHKPKNKSQSDNGFYEREFNQLEEIDRGSYGVVYKAQKKGKDKGFYAIKITYPLNNEKKNEMLREVEVLWNLKEKYVVRYYNAWLEDHFIEKNDHKTYNSSMFSLYIQMEYCAGTLEHFMEQFDECASFISNINSDKILTPVYYHIYCKLFEELIQCVDYLHRQNKIHRDLRPANILIPREINGKFIKIGDFGLVTCHDFKSKSHSKVKADLKYVAPEIERGEDHNVKADIYSLGRMMGLLFRVDNYV